MQALLEQNGKPCCVNLITENDSKFLADLKKPKDLATASATESQKDLDDMTEEEKAKIEADAAEAALRAMEDEVDQIIRKEEEEFAIQQEQASKLAAK